MLRMIILTSALSIWISAFNWALTELSKGMPFGSFIAFCVVTFCSMVTIAYWFDRFEKRSHSQQLRP
jgi:uncharacterized membrane protein YwzB